MTPEAYPEEWRRRALELIGKLSEMLMERKIMLGTAESCTGGLLAALCTEVPGASDWFAGGAVTYANRVKESLLGVDGVLLARHGAVSAEVVQAMAVGALSALECQAALAVSGIAGPGGGSLEKPVGTVWMAVALGDAVNAETVSRRFLFSGSRQDIRGAAVIRCLEMAYEILLEKQTHSP